MAQALQPSGGGQGDGNPGGKGAGSVREAGENRAEDSQGGGKWVKEREKLRNIAQYFAIKMAHRGGSQGGNQD